MKKHKLSTLILLFPLLLSLSSILPAQDSVSIEFTGSALWSNLNDIYVVDNYAYCTFYRGLAVFDITNPEQPVLVHKTHLSSAAHSLDIQGGRIVTANALGRYNFFRISNPAAPSLIYTYHTSDFITDIAIDGNYVYLSIGTDGIEIHDVSDQNQPVYISTCDTPGNARSLIVNNGIAYIADSDSGLQIIDVSEPTNPEIISSISDIGAIDYFDYSNNYIYVKPSTSLFYTIDVSNPSEPQITGDCELIGVLLALKVSENFAFVAHLMGMGIDIIDISDPENPTVFGIYNPWQSYTDLMYTDGYIYVSRYTHDMEIVDVSNPNSFELRGKINNNSVVQDVAVKANYAYAVDLTYGFHIVDIENPFDPVTVGRAFIGGYASFSTFSIALKDSLAIIAGSHCGLRVFDISDPTNPSNIGRYQTGLLENLIIDGDLIYVQSSGGLSIFDISNPSEPDLVSWFPIEADYHYTIGKTENYVYVSEHGLGVRIIDVSDPEYPVLANTYFNVGFPKDIEIKYELAYIMNSDSEIKILDITNPVYPTDVAYFNAQETANSITVSGSLLYISLRENGLEIFDVSDPSEPEHVGFYDSPGKINRVTVNGNYVYTSDDYAMEILHQDFLGSVNSQSSIPTTYSLSQNYPNPFNAQTVISYDLPRLSDVSIDIYDILGRQVEAFNQSTQSAGSHQLIWNSEDVSSGVYFYKITAGDYSESKKMTLVK